MAQCPVLWVFTYFKSYLGQLRVLSTQTGMIPQQRAKQLRFPLMFLNLSSSEQYRQWRTNFLYCNVQIFIFSNISHCYTYKSKMIWQIDICRLSSLGRFYFIILSIPQAIMTVEAGWSKRKLQNGHSIVHSTPQL